MVTTTAYLEQSVRTVFKNKDDLADAQACLSESGIPAVISCLDVACSCSFSALANLRNDPPPQAVAISIGDAITASGGQAPDDIYLKKKVGNADLITSAKDLSGAVNELAASGGGGGGVYTPVGTLGSFYSCSSLDDTTPTLVATGSSTVAGMAQARQKCINWAYTKEWESTASSIILADKGETHAYVSSSSSGSCYDAVGQLMTQKATMTYFLVSGDRIYHKRNTPLDPIKVICSSSVCQTESKYITLGWNSLTILPEMSVTCSGAVCSTSEKYVDYTYRLTIPARVVYCDSFPCVLEGYDIDTVSINDRTITCVGDVCSTSEIIASSSGDFSFYIPSQSVTCAGSTCSIGFAQYDPISLTIPVRSTTCADSDGDGVIDCTNLAEITLTDSIGGSVSIPETAITCSDTYDTCKTAQISITITNALGDYQYNIYNQALSCTGSSCSILETIIHSRSDSAQTLFYIPALPVGATSATAGSLENLCMRSLDYEL